MLLAFLAAAVIFLFFIGDRSWIFGVAIGVFAIWAGVVIFSYFRFLNISLDKFNRMEIPRATFYFDDEGIVVSADSGKSELAWKFVNNVLQYPEAWLMVLGGGSYFTLPTAELNEELRAFILNKVELNGEKAGPPNHV
jgi:hypothetical protein